MSWYEPGNYDGCASGCYWNGGGVCSACGQRLRCGCGRFVREDGLEAHESTCPMLAAAMLAHVGGTVEGE